MREDGGVLESETQAVQYGGCMVGMETMEVGRHEMEYHIHTHTHSQMYMLMLSYLHYIVQD